jgi:hypothetical protein
MRRLLLAGLIVAAAAVGLWAYAYRRPLEQQLACYRVGSAETYELARRELAWFETGPDRDERLRRLVARWGTGNQRLDLYLARYVHDPAASEAYRQAFSLEMAWRPELIGRWAHYWSWQTEDPADETASIRRYLNALVAAERPRAITWREVLDLQAVFHLTGQSSLALRLSPKNWPSRYRRWQHAVSSSDRQLARPTRPFPSE